MEAGADAPASTEGNDTVSSFNKNIAMSRTINTIFKQFMTAVGQTSIVILSPFVCLDLGDATRPTVSCVGVERQPSRILLSNMHL